MSSPGGPSFPSGLLSGGTSPSGDEGFFPFVLERRDSFLGGGPGPEEREDLALQLQQKEKDLLLAAQLGKMLLERNEELRRQLETLNAQHLEHEEQLQQENHELRRGLAARGAEWEARTVELEGDVEALRAQLGEQRSEQQDSGRERARALSELSEQNLRLSQQLAQASRTEQELQQELDALRGQYQSQVLAGVDLRAQLESLQAENQMLQSRRQDLEAQIQGLHEEVDKGQRRLQTTHMELLLLRRERKEHSLELERARLETGEALSALRRLQRRVSELEEESRHQNAEVSSTSLQLELAHSLDGDQDANETKLTHSLDGDQDANETKLAHSLDGDQDANKTKLAHSPDGDQDANETKLAHSLDGDQDANETKLAHSLDGDQDANETKLAHSLDGNQDPKEGGDDLTILPPVTQDTSSSQSSIQEESLEPPKKRASLSPVEKLEEKEAEVARLQDEISLQRTELEALRGELRRQKELREQDNPEDAVSSAISDRDEAVNKALKLSLELSRVSLERDSLSRELLGAIRQKVALTQELEAWQDDMQVVIGQQLRSQRQKELTEAAATAHRATAHSSLRLGSRQPGGFLSNLFRRT